MDEERWKFISEHTAWKTHASQSLAKELYAYCEKLRAENFALKQAFDPFKWLSSTRNPHD